MRDEKEQKAEGRKQKADKKPGSLSMPTACRLLPSAFSSLIPHPSSLLKWLVHISRFGLAALWLFAAGAKIYMRNSPTESFFKNVGSLVGESWAVPVAIAVICAEIIAAAPLIWPRTARIGGILSATPLIGFSGYALHYRS